MGKKNKKKKTKKAQEKYFHAFGYQKQEKPKKGKKNKSLKKANLKSVKPTLDRKEAKANRKTVKSPVDVPKEFRKNRMKCNHVGGLLTVAEYKQMTPSYSAFTPALDAMVAKYGAEHISVCNQCFDVLVDRDCITPEKVQDALLTLYAACNVVVANRRMKPDEVKDISKLKDVFGDFQEVEELLAKVIKESKEETLVEAGRSGNKNINGVPSSVYMG